MAALPGVQGIEVPQERPGKVFPLHRGRLSIWSSPGGIRATGASLYLTVPPLSLQAASETAGLQTDILSTGLPVRLQVHLFTGIRTGTPGSADGYILSMSAAGEASSPGYSRSCPPLWVLLFLLPATTCGYGGSCVAARHDGRIMRNAEGPLLSRSLRFYGSAY